MTHTIEKLKTKKGDSYWNDTGAYQKDFDRLWKELVPPRDKASTIQGELIRIVNNFAYEYYNNGNCNSVEIIKEDCEECDGSGWEVYNDEEKIDCSYCGGECQVYDRKELRDDYEDYIYFLNRYLKEDEYASNLKEFLLSDDKGYGKYKFDDDEERVYVDLTDAVMYQVLTTENENI